MQIWVYVYEELKHIYNLHNFYVICLVKYLLI